MSDNSDKSKAVTIITGLLYLLLVVAIASTSAVTLLWITDVYEEQGLSLFSNRVIIASVVSFFASILMIILGESLIEDIVKIILVCGLLFALHKYPSADLVIIGLIAGFVTGFIFNRVGELRYFLIGK